MYDIDALREDISPLSAAKGLGLNINKQGSTIFVQCPAHQKIVGKPNTRITCCELGHTFNSAFYCYGCGAHGSVFEMIAYAKDLNMKADFGEIIKTAAEMTGNPDAYKLKDYQTIQIKKAKSKKFDPGITDQELKMIGLSGDSGFDAYKISSCHPSYMVSKDDAVFFEKDKELELDNDKVMEEYNTRFPEDMKENGYEEYYEKYAIERIKLKALLNEHFSDQYYVTKDYMKYNINIFAKEDPEEFKNLVKRKCIEKFFDIKNKYDDIPDLAVSVGLNEQALSAAMKDIYMNVYNIYSRFATKDELEAIDLTWVYDYEFIL